MSQLAGKTAVVTGGSRGFGRATVEALAAEGMQVTAVARGAAALATLEREVGTVRTVAGDVADPRVAARVLAETRPRVLVLNAGARSLSRPSRFHTWETFSAQLEVDVKATFLWSREALLLPLEPGSTIVVVSSGAALSNFRLIGGYAAAKAAQWAFARCLAEEARELGVLVRCLLPNMSPDTEMGREGLRDFERYLSETEVAARKSRDSGPALTAADVGAAVLKLLKAPEQLAGVSFQVAPEGVAPMP